MKGIFFLLISVVLVNCLSCNTSGSKSIDYSSEQTTPEINDWVVILQNSDADMLHPTNYFSSAAGLILDRQIFQGMMDINPETKKYEPSLAKTEPVISENGLSYTFEIRNEAKWDNGQPITGYDYLFTLKALKNPLADNAKQRFYYEFIKDVTVDSTNPKKFTVHANQKFHLAYPSIASTWVMPEYIYDPGKVLSGFSFEQLSGDTANLSKNKTLQEFSTTYNSSKYQRNPEFIVGSGPYKVKEWISGQQIVLERKTKWWGDACDIKLVKAWPERIVYRIINDMNSGLTALKAQEIDVMDQIKANHFKEIKLNPKVTDHFTLSNPNTYGYSFIGMNMKPGSGRKQIFSDKQVRIAFSKLINIDQIISTLFFGYAQRITGPVAPLKKGEYHEGIKPVEFNPTEAKAMLETSGWKDTDGNGILDKRINGKKTEFEIEYSYNQGNDIRKKVGLMIADEAKKIGIIIKVVPYEYSVYLKKLQSHDFDLHYSALSTSQNPSDFKENFSTRAWSDGGINYSGFGTAKTDLLIDSIRQELDENKRNILVKRFQEIVSDECPAIYLYNVQNMMAIHKRFRNADPYPVRPYYFAQRFWVPANLTRYTSDEPGN